MPGVVRIYLVEVLVVSFTLSTDLNTQLLYIYTIAIFVSLACCCKVYLKGTL